MPEQLPPKLPPRGCRHRHLLAVDISLKRNAAGFVAAVRQTSELGRRAADIRRQRAEDRHVEVVGRVLVEFEQPVVVHRESAGYRDHREHEDGEEQAEPGTELVTPPGRARPYFHQVCLLVGGWFCGAAVVRVRLPAHLRELTRIVKFLCLLSIAGGRQPPHLLQWMDPRLPCHAARAIDRRRCGRRERPTPVPPPTLGK